MPPQQQTKVQFKYPSGPTETFIHLLLQLLELTRLTKQTTRKIDHANMYVAHQDGLGDVHMKHHSMYSRALAFCMFVFLCIRARLISK